VLTNLMSRAASSRIRREPGRIMIWSRRANGAGGISETLYKVRANFLDGNKSRVLDNHLSCGDIDGDGADEIVITFKRPFADQILTLDDASNDFALLQHSSLDTGYLTTAEDSQRANFTGDVFPSVLDIDEDGMAEIVIVHATGSNFTYTKYDDADTNFALLP